MLEIVKNTIQNILESYYFEYKDKDYNVSFTENPKFGDVAVNIAMLLAKDLGKNPKDLASDIINKIQSLKEASNNFSKIEVAGPGFINFTINHSVLIDRLGKINKRQDSKWQELESKKWSSKNILVEHTSPNLFKPVHVGLLMNNAIGEACYNLLKEGMGNDGSIEAVGFPSDKSIGIAKALYVLNTFHKDFADSLLDNKCTDNPSVIIEKFGNLYAEGVKYYSDNPDKEEEIKKVSNVIYSEDESSEYLKLYNVAKIINVNNLNKWILENLDTSISKFIYESEVGDIGINIINKNKNLFKQEEGSNTVYYDTNIKKSHDSEETFKSVFINSEGHPTYEAKDLGLLFRKKELNNPDVNLFVTDSEQIPHFNIVLDVASKIKEISDIAKKSIHVPHGRMTLRGEKMSSRFNNVLTAEEIFLLIKDKIKVNNTTNNSNNMNLETEKKVALATLKIAILKSKPGINIDFDPDRDISNKGNTGIYLMWTYARARSLISKYEENNTEDNIITEYKEVFSINSNRYELSRKILQYEYFYKKGIDNLEPQVVVAYLFDLAKEFNSFYEKQENISSSHIDIFIVRSFVKVLKKGFNIIGITEVEKM